MSPDELAARRGLTFGQAEGVDPLPTQMRKGEINDKLRAQLWEVFHILIQDNTYTDRIRGTRIITDPLRHILLRYFVDKQGKFPDKFPESYSDQIYHFRFIFEAGSYVLVFNFIQHVLEYPTFREFVSKHVNRVLAKELSYYRVYDQEIIGPIISETDTAVIQSALQKTAQVGAQGPRTHIRNAIACLNNSDFTGSVRESIGAVESISKILASNPKAELGTALSILEKSTNIHGGMKAAFMKLYGYTSDQKGIRHALLFEDKASVDEADALFMIGACSSFVTYVITRATEAGISVTEPA